MHRRGFVAAFALVALVAGERRARAQACCASTSAIFPARLADDENGLVGLAVKGAAAFGSFDGGRVLHAEPAGAGEIDLGQTLLVTGRVADEPVQINIAVPFVETYRSLPPSTDFGGGVGDVSFSMRWDVLEAGRDPVVPGIAPLLTLTLPSGTPLDTANGPLGADATGLGSAQLGGGVSLEKTFGRALFAFTGTASFRGTRTVHGIHSQLGPDLAATVGASYTFRSGFSLGGAVTYSNSFDSSIDGVDAPDSARALTQLAVIGALPLGGGSRLLGSLFFVPPISGVGQNEVGTVGLSFTFIYGLAKRPVHRECAKGVCHPGH
jgi:hypothetical protein